MARKAKINYDLESDILYIYSGEKAKESIQIDNFVIDLSSDENVIGVEIQQASVMIRKMLDIDISKNDLKEIKEASISFIRSRELAFVKVMLHLKINNSPIEKIIQVPMPIAVTR